MSYLATFQNQTCVYMQKIFKWKYSKTRVASLLQICAQFCFTHEKINFFAFFVWLPFAKKTIGWVNIKTKENVVPSKRHCIEVEWNNKSLHWEILYYIKWLWLSNQSGTMTLLSPVHLTSLLLSWKYHFRNLSYVWFPK